MPLSCGYGFTLSYRAACYGAVLLLAMAASSFAQNAGGNPSPPAPSRYSGYSGTDPKRIPPAPSLGPANSVFTDPTFGSRILRVTDARTGDGASFMTEDGGYFRTFNANATAIKLRRANGQSYWLEFNAAQFQVGGTEGVKLHPLSFDVNWEWSAIDPDIIYFLNGNKLAKYNKATDVVTSLAGPPNGDPVTYHVAVVGRDKWVCSAACPGGQNTYTKVFCVNPSDTSQTKFFDIVNRTVNGMRQDDPQWPTSAAGQTLGIHALSGGPGADWLNVTFHRVPWSVNGESVLNLQTNQWSLLRATDWYWSGHAVLGDGKLANESGSINGMDGRGAVIRDANHLMDSSKYLFIGQPPTTAGFFDSDHKSWFNATTNPNAPVLSSRYNVNPPPGPLTWYGEIIAAATDGSNTVWRFAHNHNGNMNAGYFTSAFAQISNDGRWALFTSHWDGTLGSSNGDFGTGHRIDTFIVELR